MPIDVLNPAFQGAAGEIDGLAAIGTSMRFVEFVGENLFALAALGALADKGLQVLKTLETGTMLRGRSHKSLLFIPDRFVGLSLNGLR
jgi:hypothetical protein